MKVLQTIEKGIDFLCKIMTGIGALLMAALTLDVFLNVIFRRIGRPIVVSVELTTIFFPWIVCVAMIVIARRQENTALVLFFEKFKGPFRHLAVVFINAVMFIFSFVMARSAYELSLSLVDEYLALTHISKAFTYGSMVVGFAGVCIMVAFNLLEYILLEVLKLEKEDDKA